MPGIVVDSSVLIDHLRGVARATEFLERERLRGPVQVPALAAWELWKGATNARRRAGVHDLLSSVDVGPVRSSDGSSQENFMSVSGRRGGRRPHTICSSPALPFFAVCHSQRGTVTIPRYPASKSSPLIERSGTMRPEETRGGSGPLCVGKD